MFKDRVPEICVRVISSVCLNIKMHMYKTGPIRPGKTTGRRTLRGKATGDMRLKQRFHGNGKHLNSNQ